MATNQVAPGSMVGQTDVKVAQVAAYILAGVVRPRYDILIVDDR